MFGMSRRAALVFAGLLLAVAGCGGYVIPVVNCGAPAEQVFSAVEGTAKAVLSTSEAADDLLWLQIDRPDEQGTIGGYLTRPEGHGGGLVILLTGASTFHAGKRPEAALSLYRDYGFRFAAEGFCVWVPALSEETPYGADEVNQLVDAVGWLEDEGKAFLGVERVYVVGYSTGATTANVANLRCDVTAMVSLGGLTQPNQLRDQTDVYERVTSLFPCNTGMGQIRNTVETYNVMGWDSLDVVSHVSEIRNPTLFFHMDDDIIYYNSNARNLELAYDEQVAIGNADLPPLVFRYGRGGHFAYVLEPSQFAPVLDYLLTFEPD